MLQHERSVRLEDLGWEVDENRSQNPWTVVKRVEKSVVEKLENE